MPHEGLTTNGGAPSRQIRRGIEPRLHKLRQKNNLKKRQERTKQKKVTCAVDQLRTPSARKPHQKGYLRSRPIKDTKRKETTKIQTGQPAQ